MNDESGRIGSDWDRAPASPGLARAPIIHKRIDRLSKDLPTGIRLSAFKPPKNSFGEAFGAATGVSDPRIQKIRIRNDDARGDAATVAGYGGPGFHTWPLGHIVQTPDTNELI